MFLQGRPSPVARPRVTSENPARWRSMCITITTKMMYNAFILARRICFSGETTMCEQKIEEFIIKHLVGDTQKNALAFVAFLRENEMQFHRDTNGYWEDKLYWWIKCKDEYFCFILINGYEDSHWGIWFEDGDSDCYADAPVSERIKEIAWANVDIFKGDCGGGQCEGLRKVIFGDSLKACIAR